MNNEQEIWNYLMSVLGNAYGTAAVMGSFFIESKLDPGMLQSSYAKKLGMTSSEYTAETDSGEYPADNFIHDKAGYGLAQWTYWSRKEALLNYAKSMGKSVGDLHMQLQFFWNELQSYKTVLTALQSATNIRDASDVFTKRYEKPADTSDEALKRRADKAREYYEKFVVPVPKRKYVRITADNVNVRSGPSKKDKSYFRAGKNTKFEWCNTNINGWNAVVMWVHPDFSEVIEE